jgi:glycosyltransferase involved in cell wall biosynthesis
MYKNKVICVVVPAYNEATQIGKVITTMPDYIDHIVVIDDASTDGTPNVVRQYQDLSNRVILLEHQVNQGVGGAIATGYKWARDNSIDAAVVMAGDGQMDPLDLPILLDPIVNDEVDYTKGNRLSNEEAYKIIPKIRYFGNSILSLFTKIASGYWHVSDSQTGYTVVNKKILHTINWDEMYKRYGQPNDLLIKLNVYDFKVRDVIIKPVYNIGEVSGIKIKKVIFTIAALLFKGFFWRLKHKYYIRTFHPLIFFYYLSFILLILGVIFFVRWLYLWWLLGSIPIITLLVLIFCVTMSAQIGLFAMWFDYDNNKHLR